MHSGKVLTTVEAQTFCPVAGVPPGTKMSGGAVGLQNFLIGVHRTVKSMGAAIIG